MGREGGGGVTFLKEESKKNGLQKSVAKSRSSK